MRSFTIFEIALYALKIALNTKVLHNVECGFPSKAVTSFSTKYEIIKVFRNVGYYNQCCADSYTMQSNYNQNVRSRVGQIPLDFTGGLQCLQPLSRFYLLRDQERYMEAFYPIDSQKTYRVVDSSGNLLLTAGEESDDFAICCLGHNRPWKFKFMDNNRCEVFSISRDWSLWLEEMEVRTPYSILGYVTENMNFTAPSFNIWDSRYRKLLKMTGPFAWGCDMIGVDFTLKRKGQDVGLITKEWTGLKRELFAIGNTFSVSVPEDLPVGTKAVVIGAAILVDFMKWTRR